MSSPAFVPGQRWVSNTESELGLGIVLTTANRRVEISYPAAGECRTYAVANAPVSRVRYEVGQQVSTEDELHITVQEVLDNNGCLIYRGVDENGEDHIVPELHLNSFVRFSKPQDRLFAGQIDKIRAFELRCETLEHIRQWQVSPVRGLLGPRVQLLPHQLYIASEAANRYAPRVLLADEVGLGKTIEAGMIVHQQLITGRASRVLIVVPDSLVHQWLVEMMRRFNLFFTILDESRCRALEEVGEEQEDSYLEQEHTQATSDYNPFDSAQLVLCSLSMLSKNRHRHQQAQSAEWDLLVVDEAHHLQWSENKVSAEYAAIEALSKRARGLLLLTATPEQLGVASHFARLRLLDPDRYYDLQRFVEEEQHHQPVNDLVQQLLAEEAMAQLAQQPVWLEQLQHYLGAQARELIATAIDNADREALAGAVKQIVKQLLDRHGTGRVLFRNTRTSVPGFPERKLHVYPLAAPLSFDNTRPLDELLAPELQLGEMWVIADSRVDWLVQFLRQHRNDKVLVICARAGTVLALEQHLNLRIGVATTVFHEGMSLVERDRSAAYFADDETGAQVLVCSEIGSEGRNFQFAHHLVLFDLPLNPDLLEQRIGRLDRIGQRHTVDIHVPFYQGSAQEVLLRWYHEGINGIERTCPAGLVLYERFEQQLMTCLKDAANGEMLSHLLATTQQETEQTLLALQRGRDRLLELNSCNHEQADRIVENMLVAERRQELSSFMERVFDEFGVEQEHHSAASVILRPGDHMLTHSFPGLPEDGVTATYSRQVALSREDIHYLTWEHPMVQGAMDMVLNGEFGNTAFCTLKLPPLKAGTLLLEGIFVLQVTGPENLQLQRHLPLTTVRVVVDSKGNDLSKVLTPAHLHKLGQMTAKRNAQELVQHARGEITSMLARAEKLAAGNRDGIVENAIAAMAAEFAEELQRLQALSAVNPNIRHDEVAFLQQAAVTSQVYLQQARLKLDALRIALVVE